VFENWFCQTPLRKLGDNTRVAVAVLALDTRTGYQFIGKAVHTFDTAILDGYETGVEPPEVLQTLTRFFIGVEKVLTFCSGIHTDIPLPE